MIAMKTFSGPKEPLCATFLRWRVSFTSLTIYFLFVVKDKCRFSFSLVLSGKKKKDFFVLSDITLGHRQL